MKVFQRIILFTLLLNSISVFGQVVITWDVRERDPDKKEKVQQIPHKVSRWLDAQYYADQCIELYATDNQLEHLKKGLSKTKRAIKTCDDTTWTRMLGYYVLRFYSYTRDYDAAIGFAKKYEYALKTFYPYQKSVDCDRFYAAKYHFQNDTVMRNKYICSMLDSIRPFMEMHEKEIDSLCRDPQLVHSNFWVNVAMQYYYYQYVMNPHETSMILREKGYIKESFEDYFERLADFSFYVVF